MLVNNGRYRRSLLVFRKFHDGEESFTGGFPISENIKNSFAEFPSLTLEEFQRMSDTDFQARLAAFYTYLGLKYPFFNPAESIPDELNDELNSQGDDSEYCPIDLPVASRVYLSLETVYRQDGSNKFALIQVTLKNGLGDPVTLPGDYFGTVIVKEVDGVPIMDWVNMEGVRVDFTIPEGQSELIVIPEFQFKGEGFLQSVEVLLIDEDQEDGVEIYPNGKVHVSAAEPAFILNHISNLQHAYQDMISNQIAQEKVDSGEGIRILGKKDYIFTFEPDQPKRPIFIYPKSWGKLSEILLVQAQNLNIINDGAFIYNNNEPFVLSLNVNGEFIAYYLYVTKAMITYSHRTEYVFKF
jgi:hypothetical protein